MSIQLNKKAPDFTLEDQDGEEFTLSSRAGGRLLVVFYPGDDTPVCTRQLCDYRDGLEEFADLGVEVIGISPDSPVSHRKFRARHGLPFTLLSDPALEVAAAWGCKGLLGMKRGVFLLDEEHKVRYAHVESVAVFRRSREELIREIRRLS